MKCLSRSTDKSAALPLSNWNDVIWHRLERYVERLQQRIYRATKLGQKRKVRDLQRMLMRSKAALLLSIKKVTQINKGKKTAGLDGVKILTNEERVDLYNKMCEQSLMLHRPKTVKRTFIEKKNGKLRPLGIPTIKDRVYQNIVKMALEPEWEERFEGSSYGFRPKRGTHDAITNLYLKLSKGSKKVWVFEGDFKGCFDNLNHDFILEQINEFPSKEVISKWLKAGFIDNGTFEPTEQGTPQGGIISPLLANIALHGMEKAVGVKYRIKNRTDKGKKKAGTDIEIYGTKSMVRYADDFIVLCETKEEAEGVYDLLGPYLKERGLELEPNKTKLVHITEGFDFLGFNLRQYKTPSGYSLYIKPSKDSIKKAKQKISEVFKSTRGGNVASLIRKLNPIIRGYANYWKTAVASEIFTAMDNYIWKLTVKFLKRSHPLKSWKWIVKRYFKPHKFGLRKVKWLLTDPTKGYYQLIKMAWTPIERHVMIKHNHSPYDVELKEYFAKREIKKFNSNHMEGRQKLAKKQKFSCTLCGMSLLTDEKLNVHHTLPRIKGGKDEYKNLELVHEECHIHHHSLFPAKGNLPTKENLKKSKQILKKKRLAK